MLDFIIFLVFAVVLFVAAQSLIGLFIRVVIGLFSALISMAGIAAVFGVIVLLVAQLV